MNHTTLQELRGGLDNLGYKASTAHSVDAALARAAELYGAPLHRIPVDLDAFDARWGGSVATAALGFRTPKAFEKWRSYVRGAIKRAIGLKDKGGGAATESDEWQAIYDYVRENCGWGHIFGPNRYLTLNVLIERARIDGRSTYDVDDAWVAEQMATLRYERRKSFRRAIQFFNHLIAERAAHRRLDNHLPLTPLALPSNVRGQLFGGAQLPTSFLADLDAFLDWYRWKDDDPALARHAPDAGRKMTSVMTYRSTVSWLVRELLSGGYRQVEDLVDLAAICRPAPIRQAAVAFSERRTAEDNTLKKEASSLHSRVQKLKFIAIHWVEAPRAEVDELQRLARSRGVATANVGKIAHEREEFLRSLVASPKMQRAFLKLPDTLIQQADHLYEQWEELSRGKRMNCLRLAVAATQAAILLRTMAVRSNNLRGLTFRGPNPTLLPPRGDRAARIVIPGNVVKNGRRLDANLAEGTRPVLTRYQQAYRPLLVEAHPYGHNAADSDYLFPGSTPDKPMCASAFAHCFTVGVEAAGLDMSQHLTRHGIAMLVLRAHPDRLNMIADWLGDDPATVRAYYSFLDTQAAADDGQAKVAALTRQADRSDARARRAGSRSAA